MPMEMHTLDDAKEAVKACKKSSQCSYNWVYFAVSIILTGVFSSAVFYILRVGLKAAGEAEEIEEPTNDEAEPSVFWSALDNWGCAFHHNKTMAAAWSGEEPCDITHAPTATPTPNPCHAPTPAPEAVYEHQAGVLLSSLWIGNIGGTRHLIEVSEDPSSSFAGDLLFSTWAPRCDGARCRAPGALPAGGLNGRIAPDGAGLGMALAYEGCEWLLFQTDAGVIEFAAARPDTKPKIMTWRALYQAPRAVCDLQAGDEVALEPDYATTLPFGTDWGSANTGVVLTCDPETSVYEVSVGPGATVVSVHEDSIVAVVDNKFM